MADYTLIPTVSQLVIVPPTPPTTMFSKLQFYQSTTKRTAPTMLASKTLP
jgi:hypothetical protein